jgi:hypothetical protein
MVYIVLHALEMYKNSMSLCFLPDGSSVDLGSTGRHNHRTQSPTFRCGLILGDLFMKARWIQPDTIPSENTKNIYLSRKGTR